MMAEYILTIQQPYPGDEWYCPIKPLYKCFDISRNTQKHYEIADWLTGFIIKVAKSHLSNPHFDIRGWYVCRRTHALNLPKEQVTLYQMWTALDYVVTQLLTSAIETHFSSVDPKLDLELQLYVHQKDVSSIEYIVKDLDFGLQTPISRRWLEEPTFDLLQWYLQYLEFKHHYSERYEAKQLELYGDQAIFDANDSEYRSTSSSMEDPQWGSQN